MERKSLLKSKIVAWIAFIFILVFLIMSLVLPGGKKEWWQLTDVFFYFMMAFSHLAAIYLYKMSPAASRTLDKCAFIFGLLGILALVVVFILDQW